MEAMWSVYFFVSKMADMTTGGHEEEEALRENR